MGTRYLKVFSSAEFLHITQEEYCNTAAINSLPEIVPVFEDNSLIIPVTVTVCIQALWEQCNVYNSGKCPGRTALSLAQGAESDFKSVFK